MPDTACAECCAGLPRFPGPLIIERRRRPEEGGARRAERRPVYAPEYRRSIEFDSPDPFGPIGTSRGRGSGGGAGGASDPNERSPPGVMLTMEGANGLFERSQGGQCFFLRRRFLPDAPVFTTRRARPVREPRASFRMPEQIALPRGPSFADPSNRLRRQRHIASPDRNRLTPCRMNRFASIAIGLAGASSGTALPPSDSGGGCRCSGYPPVSGAS